MTSGFIEDSLKAHRYMSEHNYGLAIEIYNNILSGDKANKEALLNAGNCYFHMKDLQNSELCYRTLLLNDPSNYEAMNNLASLLSLKRKKDASLELYRRATKHKDAGFEIWYNYGCVLADLGKFSEAKEALERSLNLSPTIITYIKLSRLYESYGYYSDAKQKAEEALRIDPENTALLAQLGNICVKLNDMEKAKELYLKALKINSALKITWTNLGTIYSNERDKEKAKMCYLRALNIDSEYSIAQENLNKLSAQ